MAILKTKTAPVLDAARVLGLQAQINDYIDQRAAELKASDAPNVPVGVLRNILCNRSGGCECRAFLQILQKDEAEGATQ